MDAHVIIATRNRAADLGHLLTSLSTQSRAPQSVTIVATGPGDVVGVSDHPYTKTGVVEVLISAAAGLCIQRNVGLAHVTAPYRAMSGARRDFYVAFYDDDYRPAADWLERCTNAFLGQPDLAALTGQVLADGVHDLPISEQEAATFLSGERPPNPHWATGDAQRELDSMYGCNMAFRDRVVLANRFDENLPLYGWQEDRDYTARAKAFGKTAYVPGCRGVHLGTKSGRVSGLRFGYSQIANPLYLWRKGTMAGRQGVSFIGRHLVANTVRSLQAEPRNDYRGRLRGNILAIRDVLRGTCHPTRISAMG